MDRRPVAVIWCQQGQNQRAPSTAVTAISRGDRASCSTAGPFNGNMPRGSRWTTGSAGPARRSASTAPAIGSRHPSTIPSVRAPRVVPRDSGRRRPRRPEAVDDVALAGFGRHVVDLRTAPRRDFGDAGSEPEGQCIGSMGCGCRSPLPCAVLGHRPYPLGPAAYSAARRSACATTRKRGPDTSLKVSVRPPTFTISGCRCCRRRRRSTG